MIESTNIEALDQARIDIENARIADVNGDRKRQKQLARSAVACAISAKFDPAISDREAIAARSVVHEGFMLAGQPEIRDADRVYIERDASRLSEEDQRWLRQYLADQPVCETARREYGLGL